MFKELWSSLLDKKEIDQDTSIYRSPDSWNHEILAELPVPPLSDIEPVHKEKFQETWHNLRVEYLKKQILDYPKLKPRDSNEVFVQEHYKNGSILRIIDSDFNDEWEIFINHIETIYITDYGKDYFVTNEEYIKHVKLIPRIEIQYAEITIIGSSGREYRVTCYPSEVQDFYNKMHQIWLGEQI